MHVFRVESYKGVMKLVTTLFGSSVAALLTLGIVVLYSSNVGMAMLSKQIVALCLGLLACAAAVGIDYRVWKRLALPLFLLVILLLGLVLIPGIGVKVAGARRWLNFAGVSFQVSDLAKVGVVIGLAAYVDLYFREMQQFKKGFAYPALSCGVVALLVIMQPDYGTTALLGGVTIAMLLVGGARWSYVLPSVTMAALGFVAAILSNPNRLGRVRSWMDLEATKDGFGYQVYQAQIAIGAGGLSGVGLGVGRQKLGWVPEHHTDFIFSVVGEELGMLATVGVLIGFMVFVICGCIIAWNARDSFGFYLAGGLTLMIGMQAFINIGVVTGVVPNKGIPLPYISYGGSNLLMMLFSAGLILSVAFRSEAVGGGEDSREIRRTASDTPFG